MEPSCPILSVCPHFGVPKNDGGRKTLGLPDNIGVTAVQRLGVMQFPRHGALPKCPTDGSATDS